MKKMKWRGLEIGSRRLIWTCWFEGIKQGYHASKTSDVLVTDVLGFDEDAKVALDAAIESFNKLSISCLSKVPALVNKPLSKIKELSQQPIVGEYL
ncbi:hypothetical protein HanRHA438_Chr05g0221831 [Helianthus annuus]|uniref:Uncharacterized protein n=1 Tax=Helianthus annuus TaxID=4232 RepID=A0A9K3IZ75_HELAN|nr:hypothetical protein HanXRQr2_Chr05g0212341 [Helianthus annuus]KAJ0570075.1 hypothetical protein HanHA300_Chr05g0173971 [Helianthus annuus]KAJ0576802.1 hypothetical protein HanIR_Chr05g0228641 [Helianthus annuus]KAJ0584405.1 hypothetical protein HanHA89_Chr05g0188261 [Helianthus annuus]KAJ0747032.1 hypothetical protein HanOQP8_Chr05g0184821 [Helianthus annuus]